MSRARQNPRGLPTKGFDAPAPIVIRIGRYGKLTHILDAAEDGALCGSGKSAGRYREGATPQERAAALENRRTRTQQLFHAEGEKPTCYRCIKLALLNLRKSGGRSFLP